jgi:hypothetical protein
MHRQHLEKAKARSRFLPQATTVGELCNFIVFKIPGQVTRTSRCSRLRVFVKPEFPSMVGLV